MLKRIILCLIFTSIFVLLPSVLAEQNFDFPLNCSKNSSTPIILLLGQSNISGHDGSLTFSPEFHGVKNPMFSFFTWGPYSDVGIWSTEHKKIVEFHKEYPNDFSELNYMFSPAYFLAKIIQDNHKQENPKMILIKVAEGGSMLDPKFGYGWNVSLKNRLYEQTSSNVIELKQYLENKGCKSNIRGIFWLQGESDADVLKHAEDYEKNFSDLINSFKQDFSVPYIPIFTVGLNSEDYPYNQIINNGLQLVIMEEPYSVYHDGTFDNLQYWDGVHYDIHSQKIIAERAYEWLFKFDVGYVTNDAIHMNNKIISSKIKEKDIMQLNDMSKLLPPLKQIKNGIMPLDVQCNINKELIFDNKKNPTCVSYSTAKELILRDWGTFYRHF